MFRQIRHSQTHASILTQLLGLKADGEYRVIVPQHIAWIDRQPASGRDSRAKIVVAKSIRKARKEKAAR